MKLIKGVSQQDSPVKELGETEELKKKTYRRRKIKRFVAGVEHYFWILIFFIIRKNLPALTLPWSLKQLKTLFLLNDEQWIMILVDWWSWDWGFIIFLLKGLNLLDVGDIMLDLGERRKSFSWNSISQIFLDLHGYLNGVQWVQSMLCESACLIDS